MLNAIATLSSKMNVTGCENELLTAIESLAKDKGLLTEYDALGSLYVRIPGNGKERKSIMLTCAVDVPGFFCLAKEAGRSYLASTFQFDPKKAKGKKLISEKRRIHRLSVDENDNFFLSSKALEIGDTLKEKIDYVEENGVLRGKFCGKYALISLLTNAFSEQFKNDVILCFAVQCEGSCTAQASAALKIDPDLAILIGRVSSETTNPLIVLKDGKHFSNRDLVQKANDTGIRTENFVSDSKQPITKAEWVASTAALPVLTIALPCCDSDQDSETLKLSACSKLQTFLFSYCNLQF